eukprot:7038415-Pyramimonas_sp.AAC.1
MVDFETRLEDAVDLEAAPPAPHYYPQLRGLMHHEAVAQWGRPGWSRRWSSLSGHETREGRAERNAGDLAGAVRGGPHGATQRASMKWRRHQGALAGALGGGKTSEKRAETKRWRHAGGAV